jgi:hypothetical protein
VAKIEKDEIVDNRDDVASNFLLVLREKWRSRATQSSAKTELWLETVVAICSVLLIAAIVVLTYRVFHQH